MDSCGAPASFDIAAVGDARVLIIRQCGANIMFELYTRLQSRHSFRGTYRGVDAAPPQVAFDGRVAALARWPRGESGPYMASDGVTS